MVAQRTHTLLDGPGLARHGLVWTKETTPEEAAFVYQHLDAATWETEQQGWKYDPNRCLTGSVKPSIERSLASSRTAWVGMPQFRSPIASYAVERSSEGLPATAWMMTTTLVKEHRWGGHLLSFMRSVLGGVVEDCGRVEGVVRTTSEISRLLRLLGATFTLKLGCEEFLLWEIHDNPRLWRNT